MRCFVPLDETRSATSEVKSHTKNTAQHSAMIDASANNFSYTTINCNSGQTARSASDTLKVAPTNKADESLDPCISPQTDANLSTRPPLLTPLCNGSKIVSTLGWSGALPKESQSFPNLENVRGALCQMQCPEGDKEIIDDLPLFVSPCVLSTDVFIMQECNNKVVQKSCKFIIAKLLFELHDKYLFGTGKYLR